ECAMRFPTSPGLRLVTGSGAAASRCSRFRTDVKTLAPLAAATQRMDVDGELLERLGIKPAGPGRHHPAPSAADGVHNGRLITAIEPKLVGKIGSAESLIPFCISPMAGLAIVGEDFSAARRRLLVVGAT